MPVSDLVRPIKAKCHFFQPQRESSDDTLSMLLLWPPPPPPKDRVPWTHSSWMFSLSTTQHSLCYFPYGICFHQCLGKKLGVPSFALSLLGGKQAVLSYHTKYVSFYPDAEAVVTKPVRPHVRSISNFYLAFANTNTSKTPNWNP